jgi:hypothetical protein
MRLQEFLSADELQQWEQLIYANVYKALATYQQHQRLVAIQRQQAVTTTAKLKPKATGRKKQLASKVKRAPHVAPPKPLPQPQQKITPQASTPQSYNPIKSPKPLPAPTRAAIKQSSATAPQGEHIKNHGELDQRARAMLPKRKQGANVIDLISPR